MNTLWTKFKEFFFKKKPTLVEQLDAIIVESEAKLDEVKQEVVTEVTEVVAKVKSPRKKKNVSE